MPGPIRNFQRRHPRRPKLAAISRRSLGMACAPPMTLKSRYHCAPSAISSMLPQLRLMPELDEAQRGEGEEEIRREGCSDLDEWLRQAGESWTEADGDADGRPDQSAEDDQHEHLRAVVSAPRIAACATSLPPTPRRTKWTAAIRRTTVIETRGGVECQVASAWCVRGRRIV